MNWTTIIKIFRSFLNLTQEKFGELVGAGVTAACVSCWELGKRTPSYSSQEEIRNLAENTGVDLHLLPRKEEEILSKEEELKTIDIKAFREELGFSQVEFASRLGVNHSTVSKWESGERSPGRESRRRLEELALREDIDFDELKDVKSSKEGDTKESSDEFKDVKSNDTSSEFKDVKSREEGDIQGESEGFKDVKSGNPDDDSAGEQSEDEGTDLDDSKTSDTTTEDENCDEEKEDTDADEKRDSSDSNTEKDTEYEDADDSEKEKDAEDADPRIGKSEDAEDENCDEAEEAEDAEDEDCDEEKEDAEKEEDCEEDSEPEEEAETFEDEKEEENDEEKESPYNVGGANFTHPKPEELVHDFLPEPNIRPCGGGIDILYLSLYVQLLDELLNQFSEAKAKALSRAELSGGKAEIPIDVGEKTFVLKSYDSQRYAYFLKNGEMFIKVAEENTDSYPSVYVQMESLFILENGADEAVEDVRDFVFSNFGEIEGEKVSRVEMYCDIAGEELFPGDLDKFVCKSRHKEVVYSGKKFTGFMFGKLKADINAEIYLKSEEIKVHHKEYMTEIWDDIEDGEDVWRVEFRLSRKALREFDVEDFDSFKEVSGDIWKYLTEEWLSMRELDNENTTRRTLTSFWEEVQSAEEFFCPACGKVREKKRAKDIKQLASQILGCLTSIGAIRRSFGLVATLEYVLKVVIRMIRELLAGTTDPEYVFELSDIAFAEEVARKAAEYA